MNYSPADADIEEIAAELCERFCGKSLAKLRKDFRELGLHTTEFREAAKQLHDLFCAASRERYVRMGIEVKPGNARGKLPIREPGEEG